MTTNYQFGNAEKNVVAAVAELWPAVRRALHLRRKDMSL